MIIYDPAYLLVFYTLKDVPSCPIHTRNEAVSTCASTRRTGSNDTLAS